MCLLIKENNFSFLKDLFLTIEMTSEFFYMAATKKILFQLGPDFYIMTKRFRVSSPNMIFGIIWKKSCYLGNLVSCYEELLKKFFVDVYQQKIS